MSALAPQSKIFFSAPRRMSEFDATREVSRITSSAHDPGTIIDAIASFALRVSGVKRIQLEYLDSAKELTGGALSWGAETEKAPSGSAVAEIRAAGRHWGELRLFFDLQPSALENPLRFEKFLAQQIAIQIHRLSLEANASPCALR